MDIQTFKKCARVPILPSYRTDPHLRHLQCSGEKVEEGMEGRKRVVQGAGYSHIIHRKVFQSSLVCVKCRCVGTLLSQAGSTDIVIQNRKTFHFLSVSRDNHLYHKWS